jgi:glycyl-tRNA synthetase alpha chain
MEVGQFTYFQQVGGITVVQPSFEMTYGLERLAMYVQGVEDIYKLDFNGAGVSYGDVFLRAERDYSKYNFELADTDMLIRHFEDAERECAALAGALVAQPAYDQCIKASHLFNQLDARGVISVAERASYIGRVRTLAKICAEIWVSGESNA